MSSINYEPSKTTWLNPNIEYLFDYDIREYDIQDAGFNLIKQFKLLPEDEIKRLERIGKGKERHIQVGLLQRENKELSEKLLNSFAEARKIFISFNKLDTVNNLISVKKDAMFIIGTVDRVKFGKVIWNDKNRYTSYIRFPENNNIELYYSEYGIDVKGMSDISVNRHRIYMLEWLREMIKMIENKDNRIKRKLISFIEDYKSGNLNEAYYLEFNNMSKDINPLYNYQHIIIPMAQIVLREFGD